MTSATGKAVIPNAEESITDANSLALGSPTLMKPHHQATTLIGRSQIYPDLLSTNSHLHYRHAQWEFEPFPKHQDAVQQFLGTGCADRFECDKELVAMTQAAGRKRHAPGAQCADGWEECRENAS